jgi:pimeloyl-ACP methyl ester carboxylesterase
MLTIETRVGQVAYEEYRAGIPLMLLSANPGDRYHFDDIVPRLGRSFRTIALDWPGYGDLPAPEPHPFLHNFHSLAQRSEVP